MYTNLWLCTQEMKGEQNRANAPAVINANDFLIEAMHQVEDVIEDYCEQEFAPRIVSYYLDVDMNTVDLNTNQLNLGQAHLEVTSVEVDGTALTLWDGQASTRDAADYHLYPRGVTPFYDLQGLQNHIWLPDDEKHFIQGIAIEGVIGYRRNYPAEGWQASGDTVQNNPLSISGTSLIVTDVQTSAFGGGAPRFSEGQLLRIGGTEFARVWAISENTLTVERAVRGSTAASHVQGVAIDIWQAQPELVRAATRYVIYMAKRRAVYETLKIEAGGVGQVTISSPARMPEETQSILDRLHNPAIQLRAV